MRCGTVEEVLHRCTARASQRANLNGLSRVLLDVAALGDRVALFIAQSCGAALGDYALAAARKVSLEKIPFDLVLAGGVLRHPSQLLPDALILQVKTAFPKARPVKAAFEPVVGALLLALELNGGAYTEEVAARLSASLPPSSLFLT